MLKLHVNCLLILSLLKLCFLFLNVMFNCVKIDSMGIVLPSSMIQKKELYISNFKFESYDELLKNVQDFYYAKGYEVSIRDSKRFLLR